MMSPKSGCISVTSVHERYAHRVCAFGVLPWDSHLILNCRFIHVVANFNCPYFTYFVMCNLFLPGLHTFSSWHYAIHVLLMAKKERQYSSLYSWVVVTYCTL